MNHSDFSLGSDLYLIVAAYVAIIFNFLVVFRKGPWRAITYPSLIWLVTLGIFIWVRWVHAPHLFGGQANETSARTLWFRLFIPVLLQSVIGFFFGLMGLLLEKRKPPFILMTVFFSAAVLAVVTIFTLFFLGKIPG